MCREEDLNLHVLRHTYLKRARLPFRHLGQHIKLYPTSGSLLVFCALQGRAIKEK